jgi:hypothetical protein
MRSMPVAGLGSRAVLVVPLILLLLPVLLAGCSAGVNETTTTAASTVDTQAVTTSSAATASTEPGATTTTEKLSSAETQLPTGHIKALGFIDKVWEEGGKRYISIDYADWLTGQEAVDAAAAAGYTIEPGEDEYWIRNDNPQKRVFQVADTAAMTSASTTPNAQGEMVQSLTWDTFMSFWSASPPTDPVFPLDLDEVPWWIERDGQTVVKIDQQYLP